MRLIHLIDTFDQINFGIWNAVSSNFPYIESKGYSVEIWHESGDSPGALGSYTTIRVGHKSAENLFKNVKPETTVVISHGCWKGPTRWGQEARKMGFRWVALPHGMLEPWSMAQKPLKKWLYFHLIERKRLSKANVLIAVSRDERQRLQKQFDNQVLHIPNGIVPYRGNIKKSEGCLSFLFIARLHHKKGVLPLVKAWVSSSLVNEPKYQLNIAGPDEGELSKIKKYLSLLNVPVKNISILGPVYGEKKEQLLKSTHIYILPSFSEGFPTSILEAATFGCYPMFTKGCNFSEAFEASIATKITTDPDSIRVALDEISKIPVEELIQKGLKAKSFVDTHYNLKIIGQSYLDLFQKNM